MLLFFPNNWAKMNCGGISGFVFVWLGFVGFFFCKIKNCLTWNILPLFNYCSVPDVALDREVEGGLLLGDMGQGVPFRPGTFDGCVRWRTKSLLIFVPLSLILTKDFLHFPAVFLPCSGSVMLTRGHTVLQRDSTDSSVLCIHLWWSHYTLLDHKHQYVLLNNISTSFFFLSFSQEAHVPFFSSIQRTQNRWRTCDNKSTFLLIFVYLQSLFLPSQVGVDHNTGHESGLQRRHGGRLPQQQ